MEYLFYTWQTMNDNNEFMVGKIIVQFKTAYFIILPASLANWLNASFTLQRKARVKLS